MLWYSGYKQKSHLLLFVFQFSQLLSIWITSWVFGMWEHVLSYGGLASNLWKYLEVSERRKEIWKVDKSAILSFTHIIIWHNRYYLWNYYKWWTKYVQSVPKKNGGTNGLIGMTQGFLMGGPGPHMGETRDRSRTQEKFFIRTTVAILPQSSRL